MIVIKLWMRPAFCFQWDKSQHFSLKHFTPLYISINTFSFWPEDTLTCFIYLYSYLILSSLVISSFHFLLPLVLSALHRKYHALPCPSRCLSSLSFVSVTHTNCVQYLTHREELGFILRFARLNKSSSPTYFSFFYCRLLHLLSDDPSVTYLQLNSHTAATT